MLNGETAPEFMDTGMVSNSPARTKQASPLCDLKMSQRTSRAGKKTELFAILPERFNVFLVTVILLCSVKLYVESRFGLTPGKWLLGIRTVRSTLRPCGFARVLIRDTLCCFDIPLCLTAIPAAISMLRSHNRQRLGDRLADTIVVRKKWKS